MLSAGQKTALIALAISFAAVAWLGRYDIQTVGGSLQAVARLDRWTGEVTICSIYGCRVQKNAE